MCQFMEHAHEKAALSTGNMSRESRLYENEYHDGNGDEDMKFVTIEYSGVVSRTCPV